METKDLTIKGRSGIYKISINSRTYIGSATDLYGRKKRHLHDMRKNKHCNRNIQNHVNKYGINKASFSVLEYVEIDKLIEREQFFINSMKPSLNICNVASSSLGYKHTDEAKKKMSKSGKGLQRSLGRVMSEKTKRKISKKAKKRGIPKECLEASIKANTGSAHSKERVMKRIKKQIKLNYKEVLEIRGLLKEGNLTQKEIGKKYSVSQRVISRIKNNVGIYGTFQ